MRTIRAQYHLRRTAHGIDAWDVRRLVALSEGFDVQMVNPGRFTELDEDHWYFDQCRPPTPRSILEHIQLIEQCDLSYPIILDSAGRVMDGMHRVCKALLQGVDAVPAVQFEVDPEPDYERCDPKALSYDE